MRDLEEHEYANVLRWVAAGERIEVFTQGVWRYWNGNYVLSFIRDPDLEPANFRLERKQ